MEEFGSSKVYAVQGPPGCGKSTWIAKQSKRAVEKYSPERVIIVSLTRAAARAIGGKETGVPDDNVGTMHSFCFRIEGKPPLVGRKHIEEDWNQTYPHWALSPRVLGTSNQRADPGVDVFSDAFLRLDRKRHKFLAGINGSELDPEEARFLHAWTEWKKERGLAEFTQLIEDCIRFQRSPDPQPAVIFVDEQQDFSKLEIACLHVWAESADHLVLVGDGDQSIYEFHGASRDALPQNPDIVLGQSYRVPRAVWAVANRMLSRCTTTTPPSIKPREEEGEVEAGPSMRFPEFYVRQVMERPDESFMFIAPCGYMIDPFVAVLRQELIPYWNPYAPREGRWNPLQRRLEPGRIATVQRFTDYMAGGTREWTPAELKRWAPLFVNIWKKGVTKTLEVLRDEEEPGIVTHVLRDVVRPDKYNDLMDFYPPWMIEHASMKYRKQLEFFIGMVQRWGVESLYKEPRVIVGTIHSVKGGEADNVVVFPDLSPRWYEMLTTPGWESADSLIRLFYVAMTRARKRLILAENATKFAMEW